MRITSSACQRPGFSLRVASLLSCFPLVAAPLTLTPGSLRARVICKAREQFSNGFSGLPCQIGSKQKNPAVYIKLMHVLSYSSSSKEARAGTPGRNLKLKPQRNTAYWLAVGLFSATFLFKK